ncbi:MAG: PAS domain S-box protein, partial [Rhodospirillales bacterium]|nr:PAS domain S-box protein [Rhodospirillales bacterium]
VSNDANGNFLYWNGAFEQFLGYTADELVSMNLSEISHPDEGSKAAEDFNKLKTGVIEGFRREKKYRRRDGALAWGDLSVTTIRDASGNLTQTIAVIADITDKKRAEVALVDREALLSSVLERSFDGMVTLKAIRDESGQIVDFEYTGISGAAVRILGQDPVGKRFLELFPTSHETGQFNRYVDVVETGRAADIETQYKGILPGDPWLRLVAAPVENGFAIAFSDVSDIKNAEKALMDRKAVLTSVLERSFDGMVTLIAIRDEGGQIVDFEYTSASGKAAQIMAQNPVGKRLFEIFPAARESGQFDRYKGVIETGQAVDVETQYKDLLPGDPWLRMVAAPMEGGVAIAFTDITEIKNAERSLREQAAIIAQIHESIISTDLDGIITGWNDGAEKLFGCGRKEAIGLHYSTFYAEENADALKVQIENPIVKNGRHELEIELRRKSGEIFIGHVLFSVLLDEAGRPAGMVGYTIDITERKAAEEALKTAYAEMEMRVENRTQDLQTELVRGQRTQKELETAKELAEQASRAKSEFLSRVSHELRTPMNAILGFGQLLQYDKKSSLTGDQPQYVNEIMSAGDHLLMLISQLLDMSKIETGNMELSLTRLASGPLIEECVAMTLAQAEARGICVHNNGAGLDLPPVLADPLRFKQILLNLLSNAVKYNRDNGEVFINCRETDAGTLRLTVTDQGQGIAPDKYDSVFEPFNRAGAENADIPGTGIGLAIAKQMVELMDGEIGLESTVGTGSSFWFTIPLAREPVETLSL